MPPVIHQKKCTACGRCALLCPMDVFGPAEPGTIPVVRYPEECWHCRACVMECRSSAIELRYPLTHTLVYRESFSAQKGGEKP